MAIFVFTLDMPTFKGNQVHDVIGKYEAGNVAEIFGHLSRGMQWLKIEEMRHTGNGTQSKDLQSNGEMIISARKIGKIRPFRDRE